MRSSTFQRVRFAVLLPMLLACAETSRGANAEPAPPNVVLIISDDQAWGDYSFMGHPHVQTPNLDRFASQSLTFMRGYVPSSLCRPSLATIVTGLYPHQHGITGNDPGLKGRAKGMSARKDPRFKPLYEKLIHRIEEHPTLPRLLKERGYLSLQTGKWWEGQPRRGGFTHAMTHGDPARGGRHGDEGLTIGRKGLKPIYDFIDEAKRKKRPFFLWYAPFLPHAPHTPPERLLKKYRAKAPTEAVARYWAMCEWFDETCGELLKHLDEQDLAENTLVLYVTDNGWIQQPQKPNRYAPRSKRSPYEGGIRTPIMVRFPGRVEPRKDDTSVVCSIDLAPTILSACGLKKHPEMPGVNLMDREAVRERKVMFGEVFEHDVPDVDQPTTGLTHRWMIEGRWKLIVPNPKRVPDGRTELFDIIKDPHEKTDLSEKEPDRVAAMTKRLDAWWKPSADRLYDSFRTPPAEARPFVRWWWNGPAVTAEEIRRELDVLKAAGIGGVEINTIAMPANSRPTDDPSLEWLSPEWNKMVKLASDGARERGMIADLIVGSGWPFGGKFIRPEETLQGLRIFRRSLEGPKEVRLTVKQLMTAPQPRRSSHAAPKTEGRLVGLRLFPDPPKDIGSGTDLMKRVNPDGTVSFDVPAGKHALYTVARFNNFRVVMWGAPGADGPVLDHFNREAVMKYLDRVSERLGSALGGRLGNGLRAIFCDSIELSGANWTTDFNDVFAERRGYRVEPYLPLVLHRDTKVGGALEEDLRCVRYDYFKTLTEIFLERFIVPYHEWCRKNGAQSRYQAYGIPWLYDMLNGYCVPDIPEGDTWLFYSGEHVGPEMDGVRYAIWNKYASSGAHLTGKRLVGCESMTNTRGVFKATLEDIKQADDINFITGVNHSILHGFNYSPPKAGFPGWVRYGTYFNEKNPWWPVFRHWVDASARVSAVMQASHPRAQVAILGPRADIWRQHGLTRGPFILTPWYLHYLWQAIHAQGCSADYVSEKILQDASHKGGKLCYGPMTYELLVVTEAESLQPATAEAIRDFVAAGGKVCFARTKPSRSPGLAEKARKDAAVKAAIEAAFQVGGDRVGVIPPPGRAEALDQRYQDALKWAGGLLERMDVRRSVTIDPPHWRVMQVHHHLEGREIYFFINAHRDKEYRFTAAFPTGDRTPWRWDPETGQREVFSAVKGGRIPISLGPLESLLLVFEPDRPGEPSPKPEAGEGDAFKIETAWDLTLRRVDGKVEKRSLDQLADLGLSQDPFLKTFGGTVEYRTAFDLAKGDKRVLDLGRVHGCSEVKLNGKSLGVRWYGRHRYDLQGAARQGRNELVVKVSTVLSNYCRSLDEATAKRWAGRHKQVPTGLAGPVTLK